MSALTRPDAARREDIAAFIELHIEQGPVLEEADLPAALVTGIAAIRGTLVEIKGTANHSSPFRWHTAATRWPALPSRST